MVSHAQFLVRKKTFAYVLETGSSRSCKVLPGENEALAEAQPERLYLPPYIASRGWAALRLDRAKVAWGEVKGLLMGSDVMIAPKRLAEQVTGRA